MSRRTTLRPVEVPTTPAATAAPPQAAPVIPTRATSRTVPIAAGLGGVGLVLIGVLLFLTTRPAPAATPAVPALVPAAAPAAACPSIASFVEVITSYERQARWALAASTAQTALRTPGLCVADRASLGQKAVLLGGEALFEQPPKLEDVAGQRRIATAYGDLKVLARQSGLETPAPLAIAQTASDHRLFLLATLAYADALASGDASAADRDVVRADYTAQYNLGLTWARAADPAQHQEGLARLATACRIAERNGLDSPDACNQLQVLVGARSKWPAPLADPLSDPPTAFSATGQQR
jgi:hypothetical protein